MPRAWLRAASAISPALSGWLAAALVLAGAAIISLAVEPGSERTVAVLGHNRAINAEAHEPGALVAHNSPRLVRSPRDASRLALVNRVDEPDFGCALHTSDDAGVTWTPRMLPLPRGGTAKCYAPDAAFDAAGDLFVVFATLRGAGNVPDALWLVHSTDGGRSFAAPRRAAGPTPFQARIVADPAVAGRLHLTWLRAAAVGLLRMERTGNPILHARTDDGGATWRRAARVSDARRARVVAPAPAIGPDGELYVLYLDLGADRLDYEGAHRGSGGPPYGGSWQLVLAGSRDGGARWEETVVERRLVPTERFVVFLPPFPALAIDRDRGRGRLYAAFADGRLGDADVWLWDSRDAGATWRRRRVNDTRLRDGSAQYLPRLAIAPNGRVDIAYYDRRADAANVRNEVSLQSVGPGGRSASAPFTPRLRVSDRSFDSRIGFGSERGLADLGGQIALLSSDDGVLTVWSDTRAGSRRLRRQDLAQARAAFVERKRGSRPLMWVVRGAGAMFVLAGLALGSAAIARHRRRARAAPLTENA